MKKVLVILVLITAISSCKNEGSQNRDVEIAESVVVNKPTLNQKEATYLYSFAFKCIEQEYPNKLGQVLGDSTYLKQPSELHPAFYGCFDWHSSVHGHWTLLSLLKEYPEFEHKTEILEKLNRTLTKENIELELKYFDDVHNKDFERTYGWAWLLKVAEVLNESNSAETKKYAENLKPLVLLIEEKYSSFLPKLKYPIRVGEHTNTAFGLSFALDYAEKYNPNLANLIKSKAKEFYLNDTGCPLTWEPGGFDFLSPCLQEAALMLKVLPKDEFVEWFDKFLPGFRQNPEEFLQVAEVTDRADGKLAHLDGLNFSRAWCLYEIGKALNNEKMLTLANKHFQYSYSKMNSDEYAGSHWLASFALYAMLKS